MHAGEAHCDARSVLRRDGKEGTPVHHHLHDAQHVEGAAAVAGNDGKQLLLAAVRRIVAGNARGALPHVARQVAEEAADLAKGVVLVGRDVVDHAAFRVHRGAAELFLAHGAPERALHQGGPSHHDLRGVARDHREVGCDEAPRRKARHRAETGGSHRHLSHRIGDDFETVGFVHRLAHRLRAPGILLGARHASPSSLQQANERYPEPQRQVLGVDALAQPGGVGGAAAQREVLPADGNAPAVNLAHPHHVVGRGEALHPPFLVEEGASRHPSLLTEGARVAKGIHALAHR